MAQATLGVLTVWSKKAADIATLHVVIGALSLVGMSLLATISFRLARCGDVKSSAPVGNVSNGSRALDVATA